MDSWCTLEPDTLPENDGTILTVCDIDGATGTFTISNHTHIDDLFIHDSPKLEELSLPELLELSNMVISDAESLSEISLPLLNGRETVYKGNYSYARPPDLTLNITNAPNLSAIDLSSLEYIWELDLFDIPSLSYFGTNLSAAVTIRTNACPTLTRL